MTSRYIHRYRNRIDIIAELLEAASSPTTKTKMMYKALLSYEQLKEYLVMLRMILLHMISPAEDSASPIRDMNSSRGMKT